MNPALPKIAALLFCSGMCALIYQTVWLREFRLIFGASTLATATVLAIFMGGLGAGSIVLGGRADQKARPLAWYGKLELFIAATAAITPALIWLVREIYIALGGSLVLGLSGGTILRLALSSLVLIGPTFLMGGTLPAAARAAETKDDISRRKVALLYGANTCGAVTGAFLATFFLLERLGNDRTLWLACGLNVIVAVLALAAAKSLSGGDVAAVEIATDSPEGSKPSAAPSFVLVAAGIVGFAFFLMEIVWYRMLSPLLGGSTFTFGLILAVALLGVGLGGIIYSLLWSNRPATLQGFAFLCTLEGLCLAIPLALGDRVAVLALLLRPLGTVGFYGHVLAWALVVSVVAFPAALVAGIQFPMLIALLGKGSRAVGRHTGMAYAFNTVGAICGVLAGGFGLLPVLTAPSAWRLVVVILILVGLVAMALGWNSHRSILRLTPPIGAAALGLVVLTAAGPTAVWRHSPIGAGRVSPTSVSTLNALQRWMHQQRRVVLWEAEGIESSVAVINDDGFAFLVNGKNDGNALTDAGTQIISGLIGAVLHPNPRSALVVGLGTGSTAGWLAAVPSIERVDVVELEPAMLRVAELCSPVNRDGPRNPKLRTIIGDGREIMVTTPETYDLIVSEPSNPYRAGVASLFTQEYYRAAAKKLRKNGLFVQWMQAYEVHNQTIQTAYATLVAVFPNVETWETLTDDLLFVASMEPSVYDAPKLRAKLATQPFREAMIWAWRTEGLEGLLARYVGNNSLSQLSAQSRGVELNTDDRTVMEFAFARSVGTALGVNVSELRQLARDHQAQAPHIYLDPASWAKIEIERMSMLTAEQKSPVAESFYTKEQTERVAAHSSYVQNKFKQAWEHWSATRREPKTLTEVIMLADVLANLGDEAALPYIEKVKAFAPANAQCFIGILRDRQERFDEAADAFVAGFEQLRTEPWAGPTIHRFLTHLDALAGSDKTKIRGTRLYAAVNKPFSVSLANEKRLRTVLDIARRLDGNNFTEYTLHAIRAFEPHVPWEEDFLKVRKECYEKLGDSRKEAARRDLETYLRAAQNSYAESIRPKSM